METITCHSLQILFDLAAKNYRFIIRMTFFDFVRCHPDIQRRLVTLPAHKDDFFLNRKPLQHGINNTIQRKTDFQQYDHVFFSPDFVYCFIYKLQKLRNGISDFRKTGNPLYFIYNSIILAELIGILQCDIIQTN